MSGYRQSVVNRATGHSQSEDATELPRGYQFCEASQFIEFCIELDCQDDRLSAPNDQRYQPHIDSTRWQLTPLFDSRLHVAKDVLEYKKNGKTAENQGWATLYEDILKRVRQTPPVEWSVQALASDPRFNGFGPYQLAWVLYQGIGNNHGRYAIAIRGTIFSAHSSLFEDVCFQPIDASHFLNHYVSFAEDKQASLHSGFAHGVFSLLLDGRYGILQTLHRLRLSPKSTLYLVGHSQGAAMATLAHAFLHYGMAHTHKTDNVFDLCGKEYALKSYVFAQPKPGNYAFAADFARYTQQQDNALVINNVIDPVPQLPLTLESGNDLAKLLPKSAFAARALNTIARIDTGLRSLLGHILEPLTHKASAGYGYYFGYPEMGKIGKDKVRSSWNFQPAGHQLLVYGPKEQSDDLLLQHHAWMYRDLIHQQLNTTQHAASDSEAVAQ